MLSAGVKFGVLPALNLTVSASGGTPKWPKTFKGRPLKHRNLPNLPRQPSPCTRGKVNHSYNCVDRHLEKHKNRAALIWVPEPEDTPHVAITYQELYRRVN